MGGGENLSCTHGGMVVVWSARALPYWLGGSELPEYGVVPRCPRTNRSWGHLDGDPNWGGE